VLAAMEQLSYRPNTLARALRMERTYVLGLMLTNITNPYYSEFARIFQDLAHEAGYAVMITNTGEDGAKESASLQSLLAREVDGIAAYGVRNDESFEILASSGARTVSMDWHFRRDDIPSVAIDDYAASVHVVEHLQGHGHERIGFVGGIDDLAMRVTAWRDTLHASLGDAHEGLAEWGEFSLEGGFQATMRLMNRPDRPSALFVSSDVQAFGALRAIEMLHLRVPEDVALISFDGTAGSKFTSPPLTSIQIPYEAIARECLRKLTEPADSFEHHTTVAHELVVRESCGCRPVESQ
jgi:LacI family transcriptional regulator